MGEAALVSVYVEDFVDAMENLPNEVQLHLSEVRRLDVEAVEMLTRLEEMRRELEKGEGGEEGRKAMINKTKTLLYRAQMNGDYKLAHMNNLITVINNKQAQLDTDVDMLEPTTCTDQQRPVANTRRPSIGGTKNIHPDRPHLHSSVAAASAAAAAAGDNGRDSATPTEASLRSGNAAATRFKRPRSMKLPLDGGGDGDIKRDRTVTVTNNCDSDSLKKRQSARTCKPTRKGGKTKMVPTNVDPDEPTYCLCEQVSYGEMIGCDYVKCSIEWFHFECVDLKTKPKGKWYCPLCRGDRMNLLKTSLTAK